jgi:1A family penicillin-binding protein
MWAMATRARKKPNEKIAPGIDLESLKTLQGFLTFVGKPFYLLISYCFIFILFICYLVGHLVRLLAIKLSNFQLEFPRIKPGIQPRIKKDISKSLLSINRLFDNSLSRLKSIIKSIISFGSKLSLRNFKITIPKLYLPRLPHLTFPQFKLKFRFRTKPKYLFLSFSFLAFVFLAFSFWYFILKDLPSPYELSSRNQEVSTKIYDRNGILLYKIYKNENRSIVPLDKIPLQVRLATIASEDSEFYDHPGFSLKGIVRAIIKDIKNGQLNGGSTITQQLVKNALLSPEKTLTRKIREIVLAIRVEATFPKDQILEMYLNEVSYGGVAYGIQEASQVYFGKDVDKLDLTEAALLAGLPKSPTKYSPFGSNPELAVSRQKEVLSLMQSNGYITQEQEDEAEKQKLSFAPNKTDIKAPHFVMFVRQALVDKYGEEVVEKGGLEVVTTLDYEIQKMAEETLKNEIDKLSRLRVGNGALLVTNPQTGEILAMVGSKNYFDTAADGNVNVTTSLRQPGSSIKVVNYAYALSHGFTPAYILDDSPVTFSVPGTTPYTPKDYDGNFRGKITLRSALAESRNIPAVKVLASYGVEKMIEMGRAMGITTWKNPSNYGLSLTLGGGEVKLIDMVSVYGVVANYGKRLNIVSVTKVSDYKGNVLEQDGCLASEKIEPVKEVQAAGNSRGKCQGEEVVDPRVAFLLTDILRDNSARAPSFGSNSSLVIPQHPEVAAKTGTSNDLKDNYTIGFNQKYLVAVWVGNNDGSSMSRIASGITGAAPIFNSVMRHLLSGQVSNNWDPPGGLKRLSICAQAGTLACEGCNTQYEWFLEENTPKRACNPEEFKPKEGEQPPKVAEKTGQILEPAAQTQQAAN